MSNNVYGIDPTILNSSVLTGKRSVDTGIGFGVPRSFPFQQAVPLTDAWTITKDPVTTGWSVEPNDGFLRFEATSVGNNHHEQVTAAINGSFSSTNATITIAFQLRINKVNTLVGSSEGFNFPQGLGLFLYQNAPSDYYYKDIVNENRFLQHSKIKADGTWHRIVMTIQQSGNVVMLWEDDDLMFTWNPVQPIGEIVEASFGIWTNGGSGSIDLGDVTVLVGLNQQARLSRSVAQPAQNFLTAHITTVQGLASYVTNALAAAEPVAEALRAISVGPGALFWGLSISPELKQAAQTMHQDPRITALVTQAKQLLPLKKEFSFYIGIGGSASWIISGGYSLGFLLNATPNPSEPQFAVLTLNAGAATNIGIQASVDIGFVNPQTPRESLGLGAYVQVDAGEAVQFSAGISGGIPLRAGENAGLIVIGGLGVSVLPVDVAAGLTYTFNMAQL